MTATKKRVLGIILDRKYIPRHHQGSFKEDGGASVVVAHEMEAGMVRHVFMWKLAPGESHEEVARILNTLPERCPGIVGWEIGDHQAEPNPNGDPWDGALISDHESWEALDEYTAHPYHTEVVERLLPKFAERAVVDFVRVNA